MEENIEKYKELRRVTWGFVNDKLIEYITKNYFNEIFLSSAKKLSLLQGKKTIVYDNEDDINYIFDFALFEAKIKGKSTIELYKEEVGLKDETEEKIIAALERSYTSLFKVVNTSPSKGLVFLKDMLNNVRNTRLTDLSMSQMEGANLLVFIRIVSLDGINLTSGMNCTFLYDVEDMLLKEYKRQRNANLSDNEDAQRFLFFYNTSKFMGVKTRFQEI